MAVLGHSGSHAPQLMHSATIFIAMKSTPPHGIPATRKPCARGTHSPGEDARFLPLWADWALDGRSGRLTLYLRADVRAPPARGAARAHPLQLPLDGRLRPRPAVVPLEGTVHGEIRADVPRADGPPARLLERGRRPVHLDSRRVRRRGARRAASRAGP